MAKNERIKSNTEKGNNIINKIEEHNEIKKLRCNEFKLKKNSDILFITGCTSRKKDDEGEIPAFNRYTGSSSSGMLNFFSSFHQRKNSLLDLYVLSAGYGFIPADAKIKKYDISFNNVDSNLRCEMSKRLNIGGDFHRILNLGYKLIVLRLGSEYLKALNSVSKENNKLLYEVSNETTICYLRPNEQLKISLSGGKLIPIVVPESERKNYGGNNRYQDHIWNKFFDKYKECPTDEIIEKISSVKDKDFKDFKMLLK